MFFDTFRSLSFCHRYKAISILLADDHHLLDLLFNEERTHLASDLRSLLDLIYDLSRQERILADLSLAVWTQAFDVPFADTYRYLDAERFLNFLWMLDYLNTQNYKKCSCRHCQTCQVFPPSKENIL